MRLGSFGCGIHNDKSHDGRGLILLLVREEVAPPPSLLSLALIFQHGWRINRRGSSATDRGHDVCEAWEGRGTLVPIRAQLAGLRKVHWPLRRCPSTHLGSACGFLRCFGLVSLSQELRGQ